MVTEQDKTLDALQIAIQKETDGKEYYLKASQESSNELGKKLLESLATEEDIHRQKFEEIYNAIRSRKAWPTTDFQPDGGKRLRTIFVRVTEEIGFNIKAPATELDAIQTAMDLENKTYDFYKSQGGNATYDAERGFYETLAAEEREHHLILLDYYEYLKDPAGWFVSKEHPSLDGGWTGDGNVEARVIQEIDVGTHTIFVGELIETAVIKEGNPMTYAYYHQVKRGTTPKTAPSYIEEKKEIAKVPKYECTVCGYIYNPELGDPDGGIKPGTPFEEIPADWVCPVCGATKDEFERIE